jgi:hypothetical protein
MTIVEQIREHERSVATSVSRRYATCCPICGNTSEFRRHEIRRRTFYCKSEGGNSTSVYSWLVRWKCCECLRTFTDYPPFALRFKRHVKPVIFDMIETLVRRDSMTYRGITDDQASHSSLWRWIGWINTLYDQSLRCMQWIMQTNPYTLMYRENHRVSPRKSRSKERARSLEVARQTFYRIKTFEHLALAPPTFPNFGTRVIL